ncbi:MAG: NHL repeat-containing protein [Chloroflexi bacterium]|nr:NHL repeat-containing protein [Chloroflexota bacterium]
MSTDRNSRQLLTGSLRVSVVVGMVLALIFSAVGVAPALAALTVSDGMAAGLVLGQANFTSNGAATSQTGLNRGYDVAVDPTTGKVFVSDQVNHRVLRFASTTSLSNGAAAEAVLGQAVFTTAAAAATQAGMNAPAGIFVDAAGRLWVADLWNHRVLRFDNAATLGNGANASGVLGQPDFTTATWGITASKMYVPVDIFLDAGGRLWVTDNGNNRVLRFDNAATSPNGDAADGVLGQPDFITRAVNPAVQNTIYNPRGVYVDSAGRLWVGDEGHNRVLRFDNAASKLNNANADAVLGQLNFTASGGSTTQNTMRAPMGVSGDESTGRIFVADSQNNRVLVFNNAAAKANGANADNVIGQTNFTSMGSGTSATTFWGLYLTSFDPAAQVLWVGDFNNNRVLMFGSPTVVVVPGAGGGNGPGGVGITDGSSALELWLRPDRGVYIDTGCATPAINNQDAACWQDQSGNNVNVTQTDNTRRPTYNTAIQNGMPALTYVGGSNGDVLVGTLSAYSGNQAYTIFSAFNPSNNAGENLFAVGTTNTNDRTIAYHPSQGGNRLLYHWNDDLVVAGTVAGWQTEGFRYTAVAANPNQYIYTNSNLAGSRQTAALLNLPANPELSVGGFDLRTGSYGYELTGYLGEMIFFSQSLADVDRILVDNYLSAKYNVALSANDVYNGDDSGNGNFDLDMAGIGRTDDNSHTQSHSAGIIVVNRTFLQDNGDWLTFGHLTPTNNNTSADVPTTGDWATALNPLRWTRHWYFDRTDVGTSGGTVDIIFDFSEGGMNNNGAAPAGSASNYRLLGRSGTTGQFSEIATATAIIGDQVQFIGVDATLLGSNFTLGTLDDANSPTAIGLSSLRAESPDRTVARFAPIGLGALLLILAGGVLVINRKQRRSQA